MNRKIMSSINLILTYDINSIRYMTVVRLSQLFPQLGLYEDTLRGEVLEYQLLDDAEMPEDLQVDKFFCL